MEFSSDLKQELLASGLFDGDWYSRTYADVAMLGMNPLDHFLWLGGKLRRSPGPRFDTAQYTKAYPDIAGDGIDPLLHYIRHGRQEGRRSFRVGSRPEENRPDQSMRLEGALARHPGNPTVLLCAHVVGTHLFGGERSLLDVLRALNTLDFNVVVTVPNSRNADYIEALRQNSCAVRRLSYPWWKSGRPVDERVVAAFAELMAAERIDAVHVNTIMLREPLAAAERMGLPRITHVRELIQHDDNLVDSIGLSPTEIVQEVWASSDQVIANSAATARAFVLGDRKPHVVNNMVEFEALLTVPPPCQALPLRVGLVSSNLPKKGIEEFVDIARRLADLPEAEFHLIGPLNDHTRRIADRIAEGDLPASIRISGYRDTPAAAMADLDIVLSLSLFQESFGRTVVEAMIAGRPSIVYAHGAPPDYIVDGESGFVVPVGDNEAVADRIRTLAADQDALVAMGRRARERAEQQFSEAAFLEQMRGAYDSLLGGDERKPRRKVLAARTDLAPVPRDALKIAYFCWHFPVPSETFVLNELRLLRQAGHDVRVFCRQSPHPDFQPDFDIAWEQVRDPEHLAQRLKDTERTIVHGHFVYPTVTDMVWPACELARIPFTCIAHAQDIFRYRNAAANRIDEFSRSEFCRRIFTLSEFHRNYLLEQGVPADKIIVNPNCIDPDLFAGGKSPDRASRRTRRACAIARFTEKKGLDRLILAGKLLEADGIAIDIYGYGELEESYRDTIRSQDIRNVTLHGPLGSREAVLDVLRQHDIFVCPSLRAEDGDMDGIPTTLLESAAAGLPVLTTSVAGIPDLVDDKVTGLICDGSPEDIAACLRRFYDLPDVAVDAMIDAAEKRLRGRFHGAHLVDTLLRVWANERLDLMIVSWNNLPELREVIGRLLANTALPFHLIICDNGSEPETLAHLIGVHGANDQVTLILNRENALVGPGTNICLEHGQGDYAIYVCGKEGMTFGHGWDKPFVSYMNENPDVGLAGTLCYSPSYLTGRDYPDGQKLFSGFRNRDFALDNPDRIFRHVQGGFFVIRRAMYDDIGGFSEAVPHASTDVEYSYFVESQGWRLGEVPGLMALFNKTRPGLFQRLDESHLAMHPPRLEDLAALDRITAKLVQHCNICGGQCDSFGDPWDDAVCPNCLGTRRDRAIHRCLAESVLLYRRLPALAVDLPAPLQDFWRSQFQGRTMPGAELLSVLKAHGRTDLRDHRLDLVLMNGVLTGGPDDEMVLREASRLLAPGGTMLVSGQKPTEGLMARLRRSGLEFVEARRYASAVSHYDWYPVLVLRVPAEASETGPEDRLGEQAPMRSSHVPAQ